VTIHAASLCDSFTQISGAANADEFLTSFMDYVYSLMTGSPELQPYFSGSYSSTAPNLLTNTTASDNFKLHMKNYLGVLWSCEAGQPELWTEANKPAGRPLDVAHRPMRIYSSHFEQYVDFIVNTLGEYPDATPALLDAARASLSEKKSNIVFRNSPCDRIGDLNTTSGANWVEQYASTIMLNVTAPASPFLSYFDGTRGSGGDYTTNPALRDGLASRYAAYIGRLSSVNCTDMPAVSGEPLDFNALKNIHANLSISSADFNLYVATLLDTYRAQGASTAEINLVTQSFEAVRDAIVAEAATPPTDAPADSSPPDSSPSSPPTSDQPLGGEFLEAPDSGSAGLGQQILRTMSIVVVVLGVYMML
jgi:hypothetical protein